ncbi:MAG: preprotein translocase subunit SecE [bacterium]|nr:preprotein translocase subunit SecE [bacterium]
MGETPAGVLKKLQFLYLFGLNKTYMSRILRFFREVRSEMSKVIWPSRRDTIRYTATVIVFSLVLAIILGAADFGLLKGFEAIINR